MDQTFIFLSPSRVDRRCSGGGTSDVLDGFNHPLWSRPCDVSTQDAFYCSSGKVEVKSVRYWNKAELYILKTFLNNIVSFDINLVNLEQVSFIEWDQDQKYNTEIKDSIILFWVCHFHTCLKKGCLLRDQQNKTDL